MLPLRFYLPAVCAFVASFSLNPAALAQRRTLSVREVLSLIQTEQPLLRAYKARSAAARYDIDLARNTLVPNLTGGYQAGYATDNNITGMSYPGLLMPISGPVAAHSSNSFIP